MVADVERALRWVQANSAQVGGDAKGRVTIVGQSAGAHLTALLLLQVPATEFTLLIYFPAQPHTNRHSIHILYLYITRHNRTLTKIGYICMWLSRGRCIARPPTLLIDYPAQPHTNGHSAHRTRDDRGAERRRTPHGAAATAGEPVIRVNPRLKTMSYAHFVSNETQKSGSSS